MAYEIHIERVADDGSSSDPPISLDEWKSVVTETDGLRLDSSAKSVTNPVTGQAITIGGSDGNAEMLVVQQWLLVFRWSNYFCLGPVSKAYGAVDYHTVRRLRQWLCQKHKVRTAGVSRFSAEYLYLELGLVRLRWLKRNPP